MTVDSVDLDLPVATPDISRAMWRDFIAFVEGHGRERRKRQSHFQEADYIAGAMAVFFAFNARDQIPASWVFGIMAGESPLDV